MDMDDCVFGLKRPRSPNLERDHAQKRRYLVDEPVGNVEFDRLMQISSKE